MLAVSGEELPSAKTAYRLVGGDLTALPNLARDLLGRAALAGLGIWALGAKPGDAVKYGLAGAASIEVFVLGYAAYHSK